MGIVRYEDVLGYCFDRGQVICEECATDEQKNKAQESDFIIEIPDDEIYFCDRCKKRL